MGTEAIKVVTTTSDKGVKTTTFTQTVKDKTSVFTMIDHNKDGKYDGFTLTGSFDTADLQNALKNNPYQEGEKATIVDDKGETLVLPDADKGISEGKEYNLGSLAKRLSLKSNATAPNATNDTQNPNNQGPGFSVDNNILKNSYGMCSNMLSQMIYQALSGGDSFLPNRMQNFAQLVWNSAGAAYKLNPYTPSPTPTNSDGTVNADSSVSGNQSAADGANSDGSLIETDQSVAAKQAEQEEKDKADEKKLKDQEAADKAKEKEAKEAAAKKKAETAALCKDLMLSMKGLNFDKSKLEAAVNKINKDNVIEVMEEWDLHYKDTMDNQSLIQCIHNDNYVFRSQTQYTNKIKDALKARSIELELGSDAEAFDANVTYENDCPWYLGGTSNSKVEAEFDKMYKSAKDARDKKPKETTEATETTDKTDKTDK